MTPRGRKFLGFCGNILIGLVYGLNGVQLSTQTSGALELAREQEGKNADLSTPLRFEKHFHEGSAELQIPRLRSG
jgi:hypothetical protein